METLFLKLFNMSITAGWLIIAVMLLRLLLYKAPKSMRCILWAMVGIRLLCPVSFKSIFSLIPSPETIPQDIMYSHAPTVSSGIPTLNQSINPIIADVFTPDPAASANPLQIYVFIASVIWIIGILSIASYALISCLILHRKIRESIQQDDHIWLCDHVPTPFILGIFHPRIILPSTISDQDLIYVIAHEKVHLKRHDHWWKFIAFLLLTVYWFHPLIWIAYYLFSQDLELSCDEKVIADMGDENKRPYADALISCSEQHHFHTACPLAFCEIGVAKRIKAILRYRQPAAWIMAAAVLLCITSGFCFLTDPAGIPLRDAASDSNPESIRLISADRAYIITSKDAMSQVLHFLSEVHTGPTTATADAGADIDIRDKINQISISYKNNFEEYFFSRSCTQVWTLNDNSSSLLKKIYNPKTVRRFFDSRLDELADQSCSSPDSSDTQMLYTYKNSPEAFGAPCILLSMTDDTFSFVFSLLSSYLAIGTYELTDQTLTLRTSDGQYVYVFKVKQDAFIFDTSKSSPIPKYKYHGLSGKSEPPVPDGAVFTSGSI